MQLISPIATEDESTNSIKILPSFSHDIIHVHVLYYAEQLAFSSGPFPAFQCRMLNSIAGFHPGFQSRGGEHSNCQIKGEGRTFLYF